MFKPFLSLEIGPNFQRDDAIVAFRSMFSSGHLELNSKIGVDRWFLNNLNSEPVFTDTCRGGIYLLLKSLNLPENSEVLIQGFSCIVVPNAVLQANLKPVVCDIDETNFNFDWDKIESQINSRTKVLLVQHNFGIIANMNRAVEICKKYNLILLEDCAHSLGGSYEIKDKTYQVGTFGHLASFSFGRDKVISTTTGGASQINHDSPIFTEISFDKHLWQENLNINYNKLSNMSAVRVVQNLLYPILTCWFIKPLYQVFVGKIIAIFSKNLKLTGEVYSKSEKSGNTAHFPKPKKYSRKLYPLLLNQLNKLEKFNSHRQEIAKIYASSLNLNFNKNNTYLRYPVNLNLLTRDQSEDVSKIYFNIMIKAKNVGYYLGVWYTKIFLGVNLKYPKFNYSDLQTANKLVRHQVINLPTHINTTSKDAGIIAGIILQNL